LEEAMYRRQIFKLYLANKVLTDPSKRLYFNIKDLRELFAPIDDTRAAEEIFAADPSATGDGEGGGGGGETSLLKDLMEGVVVADHDATLKIASLRASWDVLADADAAQRVAARAVSELKASFHKIRSGPAFQPTWTGSRGGVFFGAPSSVAVPSASADLLPLGGGVPSSKLLAHAEERGGGCSVEGVEWAEEVGREVVAFLRARMGRRTSSAEVREAFSARAEGRELEFRAVLRQVAQVGGGLWQLRPEFIS
jgi:hypothetical protein